MDIQNIQFQNFGSTTVIRIKQNYKKNKNIDFFYNKVLNIVRETNSPAIFTNEKIEISYITEGLIKMLKAAGIGFKKIKNK